MAKRLVIFAILLLVGVPAFAQSVDTAWARRYNGPGDSTDVALAIAWDGAGNVYVTGTSAGSGTSSDYATIKYYPNGDTAWVRRYDGPENAYDNAYAIAVDGSGNVYVTGRSWASATYEDYATIKYYPNGDAAWVRRYDGAAHSLDRAVAITVDRWGNVWVTGNRGTIKYDGDGNQVWVGEWPGVDMVLDDVGNAYVTGGVSDYVTIKYYPDGDTAWVTTYGTPGKYIADLPHAIAVDDSGNVYVTGTSGGGSAASRDYTTIKHYPNGDTAWVRMYDGPENWDDWVYDMALDDSGNIYVTGSSEGRLIYSDFATIKYYPDGDTAWVRRYDGPEKAYDNAYAMAVDGSGNVYVTGRSWAIETYEDYATIKYCPNGNLAWAIRYSGPRCLKEWANAIAVDDSGNVYVTGTSWVSWSWSDYATIKYVQFLRGDVDKSNEVNTVDVVYLINYVLKSGPAPVPAPIVGDADCESKVDVSDVFYLVNYLFRRGPPPCQ